MNYAPFLLIKCVLECLLDVHLETGNGTINKMVTITQFIGHTTKFFVGPFLSLNTYSIYNSLRINLYLSKDCFYQLGIKYKHSFVGSDN